MEPEPEPIVFEVFVLCPACGKPGLKPAPGDRRQRCDRCPSEFEVETWPERGASDNRLTRG